MLEDKFKMRKSIILLLTLSFIIYSCSTRTNEEASLNWYIGNIKKTRFIRQQIRELQSLHGDKCAPKELAYAEAYLDAITGMKYLDPKVGVPIRARVGEGETIVYMSKLKAYISSAKKKVYGDADRDGLPCFVEVDIGTNPNVPDNKLFLSKKKIKSIERKLLAKARVKKTTYAPTKEHYSKRRYKPLKLQARIHFDFGKATIKRAYLPYLNNIIRFLKAYPNLKVKIVGYTDNIGSKKYNKKLAYKRALVVRKYLINHGINPKRIVIHGFGKSKYLVDNKTEINRFTNRRAEFFIMRMY